MMPRLLLALTLLASSVLAQLETTPLRTTRAVRQYRHVLNLLETRRVTVDWEDTTLREAVADLRRQTRLNFVFSSKAVDLAENEISFKLRDVPVGPVLHILAGEDVVFQHRHGVIHVTTREDAVRHASIMRIYDTRGLLYVPPDFPGPKIGLGVSGSGGFEEEEEPEPREGWNPDEVIDLIQNATGASNWELEGVSMNMMGGKLVVRHTPVMQRRVQRLLLVLGMI